MQVPKRGEDDELDRLRAELAVCREALAQTETALEQRDELLRTLLHELRTPASALESLVPVLAPRADVHDDLRRDARDLIGLHVDHLRMLIDDVRELRRSGVLADAPSADGAVWVLGDPRAPHRQRNVDVVTLSLVAADAAGLARSRLHLDVPTEASTLLTDPVRLRRIITNLLENAEQHGAGDGDVRLRARPLGGGVEIVISNDVLGGEASSETAGEGIGLRIVEHLARSLDGELRVESTGPARAVILHLPRPG